MLTTPRLVIGIALLALIVYGLFALDIPYGEKVDDFVTCEAAGYPVMESYPRQCKDKKGNIYVEEITKVPGTQASSTTSDLIHVTSPTAGMRVQSPVTLTGEARGYWFFEASFPVEIRANDGTVLGAGPVQAQADWMTESFVPFSAQIKFDPKGNTEGVIRFKNDNPSGDPARDLFIDVPVKFGTGTTGVSTPVKPCIVSGCSGQICSDQDMASTCEYREEYACYKTATCARQADGQCGWTQTAALTACLMNS